MYSIIYYTEMFTLLSVYCTVLYCTVLYLSVLELVFTMVDVVTVRYYVLASLVRLLPRVLVGKKTLKHI